MKQILLWARRKTLRKTWLGFIVSILLLIYADFAAERFISIKKRSIQEQFSEFFSLSLYDVSSNSSKTESISSAISLNDQKDLCEKYPKTLIGRIIPNTTEKLEWDEVHVILSDYSLDGGGCWSPSDCQPRASTAIIVPYKDREEHLKLLLRYLHPNLQRQQISYCIFIAEQFHDGRFNKGILMNAGFAEAMKVKNFDCIVFHDVDMLPQDDHNLYVCDDSPLHLSLLIDKYNYKYPYGTDFGGVTMMSAHHYQVLNGHTNVFWGWGREDSDMQWRIKDHNMTIAHPEIFDSARYSMVSHDHPWTFQKEWSKEDITNSYKAVTHKTMMRLKTWRMTNDGLNNLEYGVREVIKNRLFTKLMIESRLLVPQKISISDVDSGDSLIFIEYDSTGLQKDENCEMLKIKNAKIQSSILENQDSDLPLDDLCLELGVFCQAVENT